MSVFVWVWVDRMWDIIVVEPLCGFWLSTYLEIVACCSLLYTSVSGCVMTSLCRGQRTAFGVGPGSLPGWRQFMLFSVHQCLGVPLHPLHSCCKSAGITGMPPYLAFHGFWASEVRSSLWQMLYHWDIVSAPMISYYVKLPLWYQVAKNICIGLMRWVTSSKKVIILQSFAQV